MDEDLYPKDLFLCPKNPIIQANRGPHENNMKLRSNDALFTQFDLKT